MRARLKRRERMRRLTVLTVAAVLVVAVIVIGYFLSAIGNPNDTYVGKKVSSAVYQPLYQQATASAYGPANTTLLTAKSSPVHSYNGTAFTSGGKPVVVYIGADYCPYSAFQRWPLVMALMRFGNFSGLTYMLSSSSDVYANSPTFSFYGSTYTSNYIVFQGIEHETRTQGQILQAIPQNYSAAFSHFGGSYPFIDVGDRYVIEGSFYYPSVFGNDNWTQIVQAIGSNTQLANDIKASANVITALICRMTNGNPSSVCANPSITALNGSLPALVDYSPGSNVSLMAGTASSIAKPWARVQ